MNFKTLFTVFLFLILSANINGQRERKPFIKLLETGNDNVRLELGIANNKLASGTYTLITGNPKATPPIMIDTDEDIRIETFWTSWRPPNRDNNADNDYNLALKDFTIKKVDQSIPGSITLFLDADDSELQLKIEYQTVAGKPWVRKRISVRDSLYGYHFIKKLFPYLSHIHSTIDIIKHGGFGQPVAAISNEGGFFAGLEYPAATNELLSENNLPLLRCGQELGEKAGAEWLSGDWAIIGLTHDHNVKLHFMQYVKNIRVAPAKPYALYNSWYDLRATEYPRVAPKYHMNEENVMRIIKLIRENMIEKHGIKLDAFVLDDGWDVYESDWETKTKEFPNGMKNISSELRKLNTDLGIWFGPTGGYSFRMKRIDWMKKHNYEVVGKTRDDAMLCLAGKNYSNLFEKRVVDFTKNEGVRYFKWDGIQFSCSEGDHGHAIGEYSRRAVMESVKRMCRSVRNVSPDVYLNITSGTWLSPWWVMYANQIWMDGADHDWADVPSISMRDAAITYRDMVLFEDFNTKDLWFPIANLMTHGIIKGELERLGGEVDPIDKFTNDVLFYFARGVSMYELYISPDILNPEEWTAISQSMKWARDRSEILSETFMIGGNPAKGEAYGYSHFKGNKGIIALRNPVIEETSIEIVLDASQGLNKSAGGLVLHQVYPYHFIFKDEFKAGDKITIPLSGFETAIFELLPQMEMKDILPVNTPFRIENKNNQFIINSVKPLTKNDFLKPKEIKKLQLIETGKDVVTVSTEKIKKSLICKNPGANNNVILEYNPVEEISAELAIKIKSHSPASETSIPELSISINGIETKALINKDRLWAWYTIPLGSENAEIKLNFAVAGKDFTGETEIWLQYSLQEDSYIYEARSKGNSNIGIYPPLPSNRLLKSENIMIQKIQTSVSIQK